MTRLGCLIVLALAVGACDSGVNVLNVTPVVTAIGPVTLEGDEVRIFFWVRDYEEDAVDATIEVVRGGVATPIDTTGGHGLLGLTTSREPSGRAHFVLWEPDIPPGETFTLRVTVTDDLGAVSVPGEIDLTLDGGLPEPVLLP